MRDENWLDQVAASLPGVRDLRPLDPRGSLIIVALLHSRYDAPPTSGAIEIGFRQLSVRELEWQAVFMVAISIIALVISALSVPFTAWAARATARQSKSAREQTQIQREQVAAAREQTQLQRELAREAAQPYVWADIQPDLQQGTVLHVVVGNSGPTMAQNVVVTFDPPLPRDTDRVDTVASLEMALSNGLRSLAPGRVIRWSLGPGHQLLRGETSQLRRVTVDAIGPHGALPTLEIDVDMSEWRKARDAPDGSLHHVRGAIQELAKMVERVDGTLGRGFDLLSTSTSQISPVPSETSEAQE